MRVIDAHTGQEVHVGDCIPLPYPGRFSTPESSLARAREGMDDYYYCSRGVRWVKNQPYLDAVTVWNGSWNRSLIPLTERWNHPGYPGQHMAFVPT